MTVDETIASSAPQTGGTAKAQGPAEVAPSSGVLPGSAATSDQVDGKESVSEQDNEDEGVTLHSQASLTGGVLGNEQFTADVNENESIAEQDKGDVGDTTTGPTWTTSRTCISPTTSRPATR